MKKQDIITKPFPQMSEETKAMPSLKWGIVRTALLFWVVPVILLVTIAAMYITNTSENQAEETVKQSTASAVQSTSMWIDNSVAQAVQASYMPTLKNAILTHKQNGDNIMAYEMISTFLNQQYKYDSKFVNAILLLPQGDNYYYTSNLTASNVRVFVNENKEQILQMSQEIETDIKFYVNNERCALVRNLLDSNYKPFAILVLELDPNVVFESLRAIPWATDIVVWLDDVPYSIMGDLSKDEIEAIATQESMEYNRKASFYEVKGEERIQRLNLKYYIKGTATHIGSQRTSSAIVVLGILALMFPLIASIIIFFYKKVNTPLDTLINASAEIQSGNFGYRIETSKMKNREFGYLSNSFNKMSSTLENQFERIYKEEIALRDARIMALQSQINPHFLNNTLEIINWEARLEGNIKVCRMLESLSTMLNAAMDRRKKPTIHLSEELMYVDAYLHIIRERLGKRLIIEKEIDNNVLDCYVPRLVLQPVLENAVEHGINPIQQGTIVIRAYEREGKLYLEVENNGVTTYDDLMKIKELLSSEEVKGTEKSTSLGIRNVNERLKMLYGKDSGLSISITKKGNTLSRICIKIDNDTNIMQ